VQYYLTTGKLDFQDPSIRRSPEPAPIYDNNTGVRINTLDRIATEKLNWERQALVLYAHKIDPQFNPPGDFRMVQQQLQLRVPIPFKEYPDYNFIGLIIGPRGLTQKQMEKDTGCKIAIRGKGSTKEGKQVSAMGVDEPLHVMITAPDLPSLRKAESMVRKLVTPVEENQNEHKRAQLRKLAEINGTLVGDDQFNLGGGPSSGSALASGAIPNCRNCGSPQHPTYNCLDRGNAVGIPSLSVKEFFDQEYALFCKAVGEKIPDPSQDTGPDAEAAMASFYDEIKS
jgi:splicing factor 1